MNFEEIVTTTVVSLGGFTVGLSIIVWHGVRWWKTDNDHDWKELLFPFLPLMLFGMLVILSAGGFLGSVGSVALWGSNRVGKVALEQGVGANDRDVTRSTNLVLEDGGHMVVILMTVAFVGWLVFSKDSRKNQEGKNNGIIGRIIVRTIAIIKSNWGLILPVVSGVCLGLVGGIAGFFAITLAPVVDTMGGMIVGLTA